MKPSESWLLYKELELIDVEESEIKASQVTLKSKIGRLWELLLGKHKRASELRIWHTGDAAGNILWSAYDSITRQSVQGLSEAEMRIWIEQRSQQCVHCNVTVAKKLEFDWYWYIYRF
ncbi:hypothetical protein BZZ01_03015 [Nostocales cyanobacterium HT-58-2]|nr:hypothetical protein BZZ01_03015 [Nostocales cyanobacterium HT-58-2]